MNYTSITELDLNQQKVFIRTDMNVPIKNGIITDYTRIDAGLITIRYALKHNAYVIIATHLGRPIEGKISKKDSVSLIAEYIAKKLNLAIPIIKNLNYAPDLFNNSQVIMLENVRTNLGEKDNSAELGAKYANLCDIFCYDAFATAHRAEASTNAIGKYTKKICAGLLMVKELSALEKVITTPKTPIIAIVAGSKVSTKLSILNNLADKVDVLCVGGGILNTFLLASGYKVGKSLVEENLIHEAKKIINKMKSRNCEIPLPKEVVVTHELSPKAKPINKTITQINDDDMILDIGINFANELSKVILKAGTIIWNGPMGMFELDNFAQGTNIIANAIANSPGYSLAGGGDTIAAINKFGVYNKINYVSTGGGALLEYLEGKLLPAVELLSKYTNKPYSSNEIKLK